MQKKLTSRLSFCLVLLDLKTEITQNHKGLLSYLLTHTSTSAIYLHGGGGEISTGRHISDTYILRWQICYIHPQSGCMLFLDMLCQVAAQCFAPAKICTKYIRAYALSQKKFPPLNFL